MLNAYRNTENAQPRNRAFLPQRQPFCRSCTHPAAVAIESSAKAQTPARELRTAQNSAYARMRKHWATNFAMGYTVKDMLE
jgi:hypothetical protein